MISGIVTAVLLLAFLLIAAWAWSSRTRARFDDASRLPLEDEA
jgi:cytochrome c oxidase cbb3-type subunit 4